MNIVMILVLLAVYGFCIAGIIQLLKLCRLPRRWRLFPGFLIFGIIAGTLALVYSHYDSSVLFNLPAALAGQGVYGLSINMFGDPHSAHAHYTIPWALRVPQVIFFCSLVIWGSLGIIAQDISNRRHGHKTDSVYEHRGMPRQASPGRKSLTEG